MNKHILNILLFTASTTAALIANAAGPAAAPAETPSAWKEDFNDGKNYVVQRIDNDKQKDAVCRKEYKNGSLNLYYKFGPKCTSNVQGTFVYGIGKPIELKGGTALEIRYRTPVNGIGNIITWTYADATGKMSGDWQRLPESKDWKVVRFEMNKDGFGGKKKAKPLPVKLTGMDIYSSAKNDGVERSIEIDYIRVPMPAAAKK